MIRRIVPVVVAFINVSLAVRPCSAQPGLATTITVRDTVATRLLGRRVTVDLVNTSLRRALDMVAEAANVPIQYRTMQVSAYVAPITLHVSELPLREVFDRLLSGTHLYAQILQGASIGILERSQVEQTAPVVAGIVQGRVRDAGSQQPIKGASVLVDGATKGVLTGDDGWYRIPGIPRGIHVVNVRNLGYTHQTRQVTVEDDAIVSVDFTLEASPNVLGQVVVTGTVIPMELKAVPNAMTVITAKQIEERGITHIDQLFRGDIPGVVALESGGGGGQASGNTYGQVLMYSRGGSTLGTGLSNGFAAVIGESTPAIKTYVDGVELRDPTFLGTIDAKSIDHIEIIPGPEASTIYGSGALGGVMQVFTKHGQQTTRPQVMVNAAYGLIQNNYSTHVAPQHDDGVQVEGGSGAMTYVIGGGYRYIGQWSPGQTEQTISGYGTERYNAGPVTATAMLRSVARSIQTAYLGWQGLAPGVNGAKYALNPLYLLPQAADYNTPQQTLGFTLDISPVPWWTQGLTLGRDANEANTQYRAPVYSSPKDTLLLYTQQVGHQTSGTYNTTAQATPIALLRMTLTAGVDYKQDVYNRTRITTTQLTGNLQGTSMLSHSNIWDEGGFLQGQLSAGDVLFVTAGARAERSNVYGNEHGTDYAPRYGASLVHDLPGTIAVKLRGAYGRATRLPLLSQKLGNPDYSFAPYGAPVVFRPLANLLLAPERQHGGEWGLETYWGRTVYVGITRYVQIVDNLVTDVSAVDSVRVPGLDGIIADTAYAGEDQYVNVGRVRNDGVEGTGTITLGPWTGKGTWSWTRSRIIRVSSRNVGSPDAQLALAQQYPPGSQLLRVPEHTGAASLNYAKGYTTATLAVSVIGSAMQVNNNQAFMDWTRGRLPIQNAMRVTAPSGLNWFSATRPYTTAALTAAQRMTQSLTLTLQVQNLTNKYHNDYLITFPAQGRSSQFGMRVKF